VIMEKQDIDAARGALTNILATTGPILSALQGADSVFSVLLNADKHKVALLGEVADLKKQADTQRSVIDALEAAAVAAADRANAAEQDATRRIFEAKATLEETLKSFAEQAAAATGDIQQTAAAKQAAFLDEVAQAQAAHDAQMADMFAQKKEVEGTVAALDKKLSTLRDQAKKFAATFGE
jgi:hypothetical protein